MRSLFFVLPLILVPAVSLADKNKVDGVDQKKILRYSEGANGYYDHQGEFIQIGGDAPSFLVPNYAGRGGITSGDSSNAPSKSRPKDKKNAPPKETPCEGCKSALRRCAETTEGVVAWLYNSYEASAQKSCDLNAKGKGVDPGQKSLAKGGITIDDLRSGRFTIPGYTPRDWHYDKWGEGDEVGRDIWYVGPAYDSCIKSWRADNPAYNVSQDARVTFNVENIFGAQFGSSVSYSYGPHTGHQSATKELHMQLANLCALQAKGCLDKNKCGGGAK